MNLFWVDAWASSRADLAVRLREDVFFECMAKPGKHHKLQTHARRDPYARVIEITNLTPLPHI